MRYLEVAKPKRVAVIGSRNFSDFKLLKVYLGRFFYPFVLISGAAKGADSLAERYADVVGLEKKIFPANWDKHGKRAGFLRNKKIVKNCDVVVAFWDGESKGTKNTIDLAKEAGKKVYIVMFPGE